ncbi:MAG TPA: 6,7-dimethyl-8-ribityllumazine synthase [Candidatus Nanoarchaeia archaeon]|nr:6,7-dimethyl-8-ribityllumazine synthase [Candidatus Nanoarchaeia archaeon]
MATKMKNIGIVVAKFNPEITDAMLKNAEKRAKEVGLKVQRVIKVPGAFEIPYAAEKLLSKKEIDGVVTLGAIIKGDTDHDQVIAHSIAKAMIELSISFHKPVSLGVLGPNITWEQAEKRVAEYPKRAVDAVLEMIHI